jgi:3D (Asp-Asp-Asp) domain-containing protein
MPGVTPDSWVNHLYAQQLVDSGQRGFVLARIGGGDTQPGEWSSLQESNPGAFATGAWADHRSAIAFTADSWGTWNTLAAEARLAQDEGSIGEPYVSDDIGSFLGPPPNEPADPTDLYLRWLQLGTFQPIMREHSLYSSGGVFGGGLRLPWQYGGTTQAIGDQFMQLREELVPYLYTLAAQASSTGIPMVQALYLDYPGQADAYNYPGEYLLGPEVLVAPVTTPGQVATTQVWFPPGRWTDWFTGATFIGPSTQSLTVPMDRMPVFVKAGGIVPLQPSSGQAATVGSAPLTLRVFAGQNGSYSLYNDAGQGLGYQQGQYTQTPITYLESAGNGYGPRPGAGPAASTVVIGAAQGSYPGAPTTRSYQVDLVGISRPSAVLVDGRALPGWVYDATTHTLAATLPAVPVGQPATLTQVGGSALQAAEPAATQLSIDPPNSLVLGPGQTTTVSTTLANGGPGPVTGVSLGLEAPAGWELPSTTATNSASLGAGSSLSSTWSISAPSMPAGQLQAATLSATAIYTDTATGASTTVTAAQVATPTITSVSPTTVPAGQVVTVSGVNFGAVQDSGYVTFSDQGTAWGAPGCAATFSLDGWSDSQVTFTVPSPSGPNDEWQVVPGSQATITVTNAYYQTSNTATVTIAPG